jgi:hypothetical protein
MKVPPYGIFTAYLSQDWSRTRSITRPDCRTLSYSPAPVPLLGPVSAVAEGSNARRPAKNFGNRQRGLLKCLHILARYFPELDLPPLKWSSLMYVFDRGGYGDGKEEAYG